LEALQGQPWRAARREGAPGKDTSIWKQRLGLAGTYMHVCRMVGSSKVSREAGNLDFYVKCLDFQNIP
jgi:hypothetical protein